MNAAPVATKFCYRHSGIAVASGWRVGREQDVRILINKAAQKVLDSFGTLEHKQDIKDDSSDEKSKVIKDREEALKYLIREDLMLDDHKTTQSLWLLHPIRKIEILYCGRGFIVAWYTEKEKLYNCPYSNPQIIDLEAANPSSAHGKEIAELLGLDIKDAEVSLVHVYKRVPKPARKEDDSSDSD